jgi:hypothetical protein
VPGKQMTFGGVPLLLAAGGLAVVAACGGDSNRAARCEAGQPCGLDGGGDATREVGPAGGDGGDAPGPTCGQVPPCGGDVVGDWTFTDVCNSPAHVAAIESDFAKMAEPTWCAIQKLVGIEPAASGTVRFAADGTYALDLVFGGTLDINYPASCLIGASCDETTDMLQAQIAAGTYPLPSVSSISCTGSSSCLCRATVDSPQSESGTYAVSGNVLTLTAASGAVTNESICVAMGALHLLTTSIGSTGQTNVDSDLIAIEP